MMKVHHPPYMCTALDQRAVKTPNLVCLQNSMTKLLFSFFYINFFFILSLCSTILGQSPASAPAPVGSINVTNIFEKGGQFTVFIRLMRSARVDLTLNGQLNNSNNAMTIFAPTDNAFSSLKIGTLNSLNEQQKAELVQFHMVPTFLSISQFQTVSNPLQTEAGSGDRLQLNVSSSGNVVNITTGITNASISGNVYSDNQLAIYQVDKVLLPEDLFLSKPPAPAPSPENPKKISNGDSPAANDETSKATDPYMQKVEMVLPWMVTLLVFISF